MPLYHVRLLRRCRACKHAAMHTAGGHALQEPLAVTTAADSSQPADLLCRTRLNRARALALAGEHAAAVALYKGLEAAGQLDGQPIGKLCYAHALGNSEHADRAESVLLQALQEDPPAQVLCPCVFGSLLPFVTRPASIVRSQGHVGYRHNTRGQLD